MAYNKNAKARLHYLEITRRFDQVAQHMQICVGSKLNNYKQV
jgi:hypothetical protein